MTELRPPFVTLVSGVPRSGTSLMMRMLVAGGMRPLVDEHRPADVDNPGGYFEYEPVKKTREDASWVENAHGLVVKLVHVLVKHLPRDREYRVVLMRRNLREVLASQRAMLERLGKPGGRLDDDRMAAIFRSQLDDLERWARETPGFELLAVDYNRLVADADAASRAVNDFLGGGLDVARMAAVVDPSLYRQRR